MDGVRVLAGLVGELGLPVGVLSLVLAHANAVLRDADRLGLVAERDLDAILRRHSADSLLFALARRPQGGEVWLDAGSGAGFPGMVLACAFPEARFVLVEPQQRRAGFLELVALNLGLTNVEVIRRRINSIAPDSADVITARALERPEETIPQLAGIAGPGGLVLVAATRDTAVPAGATLLDVARPDVDSPGQVLMMPKTTWM
jgi:16S rRNA (guanine527-N7)-methyltransferase